MIPTIDQIAADTGTTGLTSILRAQDHKRIRPVRGSSGIRRINEFAGRKRDLLSVHLSGPSPTEMCDLRIIFRQIQLRTHTSFDSDKSVRTIEKAGTAGDHITVFIHGIKQLQFQTICSILQNNMKAFCRGTFLF